MLKDKLNKINNKWVRLIALIVVSANAGALMFGYPLLPFSSEEIVAGISFISMIAIEVWNHWKNNNWSSESRKNQQILEELKRKQS